MVCTECKAENPEGKKYCGDCGALFGKMLEATARANFRDRQAVEAEITDAVFDRLLKWAKWLGIGTAIPLALLAIVLAIVGLKSYTDFRTVIDNGKAEIVSVVASARHELPSTVESARKDIAGLHEGVTKLRVEYDSIESNLHDYQLVNQRIAKLQGDLQTVQGQVTGWYQTMKLLTFDAHNWNQLRFTKLPKQSNGPDDWRAEIPLANEPIPASLRIMRGALTVPPNDIKIVGNIVSFTTYSSTQTDQDDTINVQYHPLPKK
jgi:hypothetical protein